jgi:hypothetical protein
MRNEEEKFDEGVQDGILFSNNKIQLDNTISHQKRLDLIAEQALQDAVNFKAAMNMEHLRRMGENTSDDDTREKDKLYARERAEIERIEAQEIMKGGD